MVTCREEALRWVHRYAAGGAAIAAIPIPFAASPVLAALETHLFTMIGQIYDDGPSGGATTAAGTTFTAVGGGLKLAAAEATKLVPVVGPLIRSVIAATAIEAIGQAVVAHYERKHPGKLFRKS